MALSNDGNYMFVGSATGNLYRISNLRKAQDSLTADIASHLCVLTTKQLNIASGNRAITSISVDPSDANNVVVTLGGYNQSTYIYYSTNALAAVPVFNSRQGNLPPMPVYASLIPIFHSGTVIIGTESGIYATTDIDDSTWSEENSGMAHVPVYMITQQQNNYWFANGPQVTNYGTIYIATHGRGVFQCENYTSINEHPTQGNNGANRNYLTASMYPDPVINNATVSFNLPDASSNIKLNLYDANGKLFNTITLANLIKGNHLYTLDCSTMPKGTYVIQVMSGKESATAKFVKM
jgi:hypothetical protein